MDTFYEILAAKLELHPDMPQFTEGEDLIGYLRRNYLRRPRFANGRVVNREQFDDILRIEVDDDEDWTIITADGNPIEGSVNEPVPWEGEDIPQKPGKTFAVYNPDTKRTEIVQVGQRLWLKGDLDATVFYVNITQDKLHANGLQCVSESDQYQGVHTMYTPVITFDAKEAALAWASALKQSDYGKLKLYDAYTQHCLEKRISDIKTGWTPSNASEYFDSEEFAWDIIEQAQGLFDVKLSLNDIN